MNRWILLDTATVPDGGGELRLMQRGHEFSIMAGPVELMSSRMSGSEEAMAQLAAERLSQVPAPRVLIGGLGMGFTLRAALEAFGPAAKIDVAELVPAVVAWARAPLAGVFGGSLEDPRVSIHETDVAELIAAARSVYDAILLDVDNGPEGLTRQANDSLYDARGLGEALKALRPGGVLSIWSAVQRPEFTAQLKRSGFQVEEVHTRARGDRGPRHLIWMAKRPA